MRKRIAFFRPAPWPPANEAVARTIRAAYPEYEVDIIDLFDRVKSRKDIVLANLFFAFKEYGLEILARTKSPKRSFWRTPYIFRRMKELASEILLQGGYQFSIQMQSLFDASAPGLPHFVYTDHTHLENLRYPEADGHNLYSQAWIALERTIYQNAAINFVRSMNIVHSLVEQYECPPEKAICVYAGSNIDASRIIKDPGTYSARHVVFVGIDWERKGGPDLVMAFKGVLQIFPDAQLTIVGCTPEVDIPNCNVVGRVPLGQVKKYYETASVFCLPTRLEPFGIVLIEALAHKLPVVATRIGAIPDFVTDGENGYLVEPRDSKQLAEKLISLLGDPEKCRRFGERGHALATEKYTWENTVSTMMRYMAPAPNPGSVE